MEFRQLRYFVAVAEEGTFTRAAGRVHIAQSGLSTAVQSLERELGVSLFDRTTRKVTLTEAGATLLVDARRILEAVEGARDRVAAVTGGTRGELRLGIMHSLLTPHIADVIAVFHRGHPGVALRLKTHIQGSTGLVRAVIDNELDIAFASLPPGQARHVRLATLSSEQMLVVCPVDHHLARRRAVRLVDLAGESFIDVPSGWGSRTSADRLFASQGIARHVEIEVGDVATVLELVRAGLGIALVAPSSASSTTGLALVVPQPAPVFTISLVLPQNRTVKRSAQTLADLVTRSGLGKGWGDHWDAAPFGPLPQQQR